jgi:hypothetical protein
MSLRARTIIALTTFGIVAASVACGGSSGSTEPSSTNPGPTGPTGPTSDPNAPADPIADPIPADLPNLVAHGTDADVAPDLSCVGQSLPIATSPLTDKTFHLTELGGDDSARVGGLPVEIFYDNDPTHAADVTPTSGTGENKGVFETKAPDGFIAFHFAKTDAYVETLALDLDLRGAAPYDAMVAPSGTVTGLSLLIGGASYVPTPGAGRVVVRAVDCKGNPLMNAHIAMEIDHVVTGIVSTAGATGIRRNYFGDNELPSPAKWSSHSGVAAFLDVPTGKSIRIVVRGKTADGTDATVVAMRKVPVVADGVLTAKISPFTTK